MSNRPSARDLRDAEKAYCNAGDVLSTIGSDGYDYLFTCQNKKGEITGNKCGKGQVIGVYQGGYGCTYASYFNL